MTSSALDAEQDVVVSRTCDVILKLIDDIKSEWQQIVERHHKTPQVSNAYNKLPAVVYV